MVRMLMASGSSKRSAKAAQVLGTAKVPIAELFY